MSSGPKNTTTTTKNEPPAWAIPHYQQLLNTSGQLANRPYTPYTGEQVAGLNSQQLVAQQMVTDRALAGSPGLDQANTALGGVLGGGGFTAGRNQYAGENPYLDQMIGKAQGDVVDNYTSATLPGLMGQFNAGGAYGGSAHQQALSTSQKNLADQLGQISTGMRSADYDRQVGLDESYLQRQQAAWDSSQGRILQGIGMAPALDQAGYYGANQLAGVGDANQGLTQRVLDNNYNNWLEARDWQANQQGLLGNALNSINGGFQNGTATAPRAGSSPWAGALGGAASGAAIGSAVPVIGTGVGAAVGGVLGYFGSR